MPIAQTQAGLLFFAHVPRCGGTAVEDYLIARFGPLAFLDRGFLSLDPETRWTRSSPQHLDQLALTRLFPSQFFAAGFALVRHPATRLRSVFLYQRDWERTVPQGADFKSWLSALAARRARNPYLHDNHSRPMCDLVPALCTVFRLEDGMGKVVDWIDRLVGANDGPREIVPVHSRALLRQKPGADFGADHELDSEDLAHLSRLFAEDYDRFGYPADPADIKPKD